MKLRQSWLRHSLSLALFCAVLASALPVAGLGQTLRLDSVRPSATEVAVIEIFLESPPGKGPTALQWEMTVEGAKTTFVQDAPAAPGSTPTGKSIRCGLKGTTPQVQTSFCMLVGGLDAIPNGKVARLQLIGPAPKGTKSVRVKLERVIGVYTDLRRISLKPVELTAPISR